MDKIGLFDLLQNHMIHSLVDYVMGVETEMDTNGRKNRTGDAMEDLVEGFIKKAGYVKDETYFKKCIFIRLQRNGALTFLLFRIKEKQKNALTLLLKHQIWFTVLKLISIPAEEVN